MTDVTPFAPYIPPATFCPSCEPDPNVDPRASAALCPEHMPTPVGSEDAVVTLAALANWQEANGTGGAAVQSVIR